MSSASGAGVVCALLLWLLVSDARVTPWRDGAFGRESDIVTSRLHQFSIVDEEVEFQGGLLQLEPQLLVSDESLGALKAPAPAPGPESPSSKPTSSKLDPVSPPPRPPVRPPPSGQLPAEDEVEPNPHEPPSPSQILPPPSDPLPRATLASLTLDRGRLVPDFANDCWKYVLLVPHSAVAVRITVFLAEGDEDFIVKAQGIPIASGIESPPIGISNGTGSNVQSIRITVTAIAHYPTTYILNLQQEDTPSKWMQLLTLCMWFLVIAVFGLFVTVAYQCVELGRGRGMLNFPFYHLESSPTSVAATGSSAAKVVNVPDVVVRETSLQ